jgi:hypothetical protein
LDIPWKALLVLVLLPVSASRVVSRDVGVTCALTNLADIAEKTRTGNTQTKICEILDLGYHVRGINL